MLPGSNEMTAGVTSPKDLNLSLDHDDQPKHVVPPTPLAMSVQGKNEMTFVPAGGGESSPHEVCPLVLDIDSEPQSQPPASTRQDKIRFLDGLRGFAALIVAMHHAGFINAQFGQTGVDLFFVLSAFFLTMGFEHKAHRLLTQRASRKRWGWTLLDYAQRRFLRVYPLFALTARQLFYVMEPDYFDLFKVLTFEKLHRYFVFWSLPLEITYYFIIPPLVVAALKLGKYWWLPMGPLAVFITYSGCTSERYYAGSFKTHLPTFLTGSLVAFVYNRADKWIHASGVTFQWHHKAALRGVEVVNLLLLLSVQFRGLVFDWIMKNPVPLTPDNAFIHGNAAIVLLCEMLLPGAVAQVLEWQLLRYLGKISFSVYLLHGFIVLSPAIRKQPLADQFFAMTILVGIVGTISYHLIGVWWFAKCGTPV